MDRENRFYCGHCKEKISKTLYFHHKKLYYEADTQQWQVAAPAQGTSTSMCEYKDFTFSDSESEQDGMEICVHSNDIVSIGNFEGLEESADFR